MLQTRQSCNTVEGDRGAILDGIEWDDANLEHATLRATSSTDGGRRLVIVAQLVRGWVRPLTAWEEES